MNFRNFATVTWAVPPGITVLTGANGAGKTNLLEAVTVLGNLTSFRPGPPRLWLRHGQIGFTLWGEVQWGETLASLEQRGSVAKGFVRNLFRDERKVVPADYLPVLPVAAFSTLDEDLILGGPELRRRFLDRLAFQLRPATLDLLLRYRRALRQRNRLLQQGSTGETLEAFDRELAQAGRRLLLARLAAQEALQNFLEEQLASLGWLFSKPVLHYHSHENLAASAAAGDYAFLSALRRWRRQELVRGCTLVGPHRDDLKILLQGRPAREQLSAGQAKLLATALRLAAVAVTRAKRKVAPLLVFDDVDAKLDGQVLARLLAHLATMGGQAILSTAHPEMVLGHLPEATVLKVCQETLKAA